MESRSASEEEGKKTLTTFSESSATPFSFFFTVWMYFFVLTLAARLACVLFSSPASLSLFVQDTQLKINLSLDGTCVLGLVCLVRVCFVFFFFFFLR